MSARELLETIEARGGVATVKRGGGAVKLNVSPRGVALELATDIQRFKPALLELLDGQSAGASSTKDATPNDGAARERVKPELRRMMPDVDVLKIGRALLQLDAEQEIE